MIVTGGTDSEADGWNYLKSTQILDLKSLQWTSGPDLPLIGAFGVAVPYKNTFLVVGGKDSGHAVQDTIFEFDPETGDWITRIEQMTLKRSLFAAFMVPDYAVNCN